MKNREYICFLRAFHGHSGGLAIRPENVEYTLSPHGWKEHIFHGISRNSRSFLGSNSGWQKENDKAPQAVFPTPLNPCGNDPDEEKLHHHYTVLQKLHSQTQSRCSFLDEVFFSVRLRIAILANEIICNHHLRHFARGLHWSSDFSERRSSNIREVRNTKASTQGYAEEQWACAAAAATPKEGVFSMSQEIETCESNAGTRDETKDATVVDMATGNSEWKTNRILKQSNELNWKSVRTKFVFSKFWDSWQKMMRSTGILSLLIIVRLRGSGIWITSCTSTSTTMWRNRTAQRKKCELASLSRSIDGNKQAPLPRQRPGYQEAKKELSNLQRVTREERVLKIQVSDRRRLLNRSDPSLQEYLEWLLSINWAEQFAESQN